FPSRWIKAQCRLLISGLAGRRWHCGSRPTRNCGSLISIVLPSCLPAVNTSRLSFISRPFTTEVKAKERVKPVAHQGRSGITPGPASLPGGACPNSEPGRGDFWPPQRKTDPLLVLWGQNRVATLVF